MTGFVINMADFAAAVMTLTSSDEENSQASLIRLFSRNYMNAFESALAITTIRDEKSRVANYVETVYPLYSIDDFKERFRISRDTFDKFVNQMTPFLKTKDIARGISVEKKLLVYIKYISTQLTFQCLADIFGVCEATVHCIVHGVSKLISTKVLPNMIEWPTGHKVADTVNGFQQLEGFPGVIGAIDGSHIPIRTPSECAENYFNRKKYPSIILQAVCDSKLNFTDVFCGWPGSVHDARVLKNSPLMERVDQNLEGIFPANTHLLGDAAYALSSWMMVPFKDFGNLNKNQKRYNYLHSATRMCIERTFGALKGRFRRLKFIDLVDIQCTVHVVLSCCAIHQLCMDNAEDLLDYINEGMAENEEVNHFEDFMPRCTSAKMKRDAILNTVK